MGEGPKIVKEIRRTIETRPPPPVAQLEGLNLSDWDLSDDWPELYISHSCFHKMISHCIDYMDRQVEVMGLILGDIFQWRNRVYTVAEDAVAADAEDSTATSVRFGAKGLEEVARALNEMEYEYLIVGWYHSHPGFTSFLSEKDLETQKKNFNKPYHTTIVIDPVNRQFRSYKVLENEYVEKRFQLYEESALERETTARRREEIMSYIEALIERQVKPRRHTPPTVIPGDAAQLPLTTHLSPEVRETIEEDIKRMIEEHQRAVGRRVR